MKIQFKHYSLALSRDEIRILEALADENFRLNQFTTDDWPIIDRLWRKHLVVYEKARNKKPDIQPWCRSVVLRTLLNVQSGS